MKTLEIENQATSVPGIQQLPSPAESKKVHGRVGNRKARAELESKFGPARPTQVNLGYLANPELRVRRAVPVSVSVEPDGSVVACWKKTGEFGYGETLSDALVDLSRSIEEVFLELESGSELGADLKRVRTIVRRHIGRASR